MCVAVIYVNINYSERCYNSRVYLYFTAQYSLATQLLLSIVSIS